VYNDTAPIIGLVDLDMVFALDNRKCGLRDLGRDAVAAACKRLVVSAMANARPSFRLGVVQSDIIPDFAAVTTS
jgi:hypothetical protein